MVSASSLALLALLLAPTPSQEAPFDILIRGGTVVDGSGAPRFRADVGIRGGRVAQIAPDGIAPAEAREVLDAEGLIVSPGFIDNHAHIQLSIREYPLAENFLRQGITTLLASLHSGDQPWPLDQHIASLEVAPNVGFFAGHTWVRKQVLGFEDREPTAAELEEMKRLVEETMRQGALGLSTGLLYVPANYARTEEVVELAKVAARYGGIYVSHMRDEGRGLVESTDELIRIAREASIPAQIQHHKAMGVAQWGQSARTLAMIDEARANGLDVKHDLYPYTAASTGSSVLFPPWALAGGGEELAARLEDPVTRGRIEAGIADRMRQEWTGDDLSRIQFRVVRSIPDYNGRTLADLAADRGLPNTVEAGVQLVIELQLAGGFSAIYHVMAEDDLERIMRHPQAMFETDGDSVGFGRGYPHPRSYGTFPRILSRYVRERGVLTLEEAIRKMTSMPAVQFGQDDRGLVQVGKFADVTVFNADTVQDRATYTDPHHYSVGIVHLLVNGIPVIRNGSLTGAKPGTVLRGPARP